MRILVTGGAGFIGAHLCKRLLDDCHSVICVDDLSSGKHENIERLDENEEFRFVFQDIETLSYFDIDQIYNLACPASPKYYQLEPIKTTKTNVVGAINVLELAKVNNAKVLQASTSEVYGNPKMSIQGEGYLGNVNPIGPRSCYDEGKRCAESLFFDYHRMFGTKIKVARIFNTYGPGMRVDDGRVIPNLINQALGDKPWTIYGDGTQTRSFCYIGDMVEGLILTMNSDDSFVGPVNLGNPHEISIIELTHWINEALRDDAYADIPIILKQLPQDDPMQRCPDITLAKEKLGWEPKVGIDYGLEKTVDYFRGVK